MSLMKIKNPETGEWIDVPAIHGKSAYQYAQDGGYTNTEREFSAALATAEAKDEEKNIELSEIWRAIAALQGKVLDYPVLAIGRTWLNDSYAGIAKADITAITFTDSYTPTGNENSTCTLDAEGTGSIVGYRVGTELTVAGNGSGMIRMNPNSSAMFASFSALKSIAGLELLDASCVTTASGMFNHCLNLTTVDISAWNTPNLVNAMGMFSDCPMLETVIMPQYGLSAVAQCYQMFEKCPNLKSVDMGRGLSLLGEKAFYKSHRLEEVTGLGNVTSIGDWAFYYTPVLKTDLRPVKITDIGESAFRMSGVEDTVSMDVVPLGVVSTKATRHSRWSADALAKIQAVAVPDIYYEVPNSARQSNYPDLVFANIPSPDGTKPTSSVAERGCTVLALYHMWQALYRGTDKEYPDFRDWYTELIDKDGSFSSTNEMKSGYLRTMVQKLGWTMPVHDPENGTKSFDYVTCSEQKAQIVRLLKEGKPVLIGMHAGSGGQYHAIAVIGSNSTTGKFAVIDPAVSGTTGVVSWVAFEDVFTEAGGEVKDWDYIYYISFD